MSNSTKRYLGDGVYGRTPGDKERLDFWIAHPQVQLWKENSGKWVCQFFVNGVIAKKNNVCGVGPTAREAIDHAIAIGHARERQVSRQPDNETDE